MATIGCTYGRQLVVVQQYWNGTSFPQGPCDGRTASATLHQTGSTYISTEMMVPALGWQTQYYFYRLQHSQELLPLYLHIQVYLLPPSTRTPAQDH